MTNTPFDLSELSRVPEGIQESETIQEVLTTLIDVFKVKQALLNSGIRLEEDVLPVLARKIATLILDQITNIRSDAPYISIWEKGKNKDIKMVYINPSIEKIIGFPSDQILKVGFNNFVTNDLVKKYSESDSGPDEEDIPIEKVKYEREQQTIEDNWERIYEVLKKGGIAYVKDVAEIEQIGNIFISTGTLIDVTPETAFKNKIKKNLEKLKKEMTALDRSLEFFLKI